MTETLEDLVDKELKQFIWQLCNGVTAGIEPIPRAKLQTSDREDVVDCMVKQYPDDLREDHSPSAAQHETKWACKAPWIKTSGRY